MVDMVAVLFRLKCLNMLRWVCDWLWCLQAGGAAAAVVYVEAEVEVVEGCLGCW